MTTGKAGGQMTMVAVEATVPFPSSRYRSRPEMANLKKEH